MAKEVKILARMPDGFLNVEFKEGTESVVVAVPPPPLGHNEEQLLEHLAEQWPGNEFEAMRAPASAVVNANMKRRRGVTSRVAAIVAQRKVL